MFLTHRVHPLPPLSAGGGLKLQPNFRKGGGGGLTGPQLLEGIAGKERGEFFQGEELLFSQKKKLKSEIFNDKKVYKQKYFSLS